MCRICELQEEVDQIGHRLQGLNAQFQISVFQGDLQQAELIKKEAFESFSDVFDRLTEAQQLMKAAEELVFVPLKH